MNHITEGCAGRVVRWLFADRATGRIVVAQVRNLELWVFIAAFGVAHLISPHGTLSLAVRLIEIASLGFWALDEIVRGVNPWRRLLGVGVLIALLR